MLSLVLQLAVERMGRQSREGDCLGGRALVVEDSMHRKYTNCTDQAERPTDTPEFTAVLLLGDATRDACFT